MAGAKTWNIPDARIAGSCLLLPGKKARMASSWIAYTSLLFSKMPQFQILPAFLFLLLLVFLPASNYCAKVSITWERMR
jgi:hypothetical protein